MGSPGHWFSYCHLTLCHCPGWSQVCHSTTTHSSNDHWTLCTRFYRWFIFTYKRRLNHSFIYFIIIYFVYFSRWFPGLQSGTLEGQSGSGIQRRDIFHHIRRFLHHSNGRNGGTQHERRFAQTKDSNHSRKHRCRSNKVRKENQ